MEAVAWPSVMGQLPIEVFAEGVSWPSALLGFAVFFGALFHVLGPLGFFGHVDIADGKARPGGRLSPLRDFLL